MTQKFSGFTLTPDDIYLIEALKVEGYWSIKAGGSIQNKDLFLLKFLENLLKKKVNVYKRLLIKIKLPSSRLQKKNIKLIKKNKELAFHIEISPFDKSKKIVFNLPPLKKQRLNLFIKKKKYALNVSLNKKIEVSSELKGFGYLELRFRGIKLLTFLEKHTQGHHTSHDLTLENCVINGTSDAILAAFSAVVDCEGSLDHYKHFRNMRVRMHNQNYLTQWQKVLQRLGVGAALYCNPPEYQLTISGYEDFKKLDDLGFCLHHSQKSEKWNKMMNSYIRKQVSRGTAMQFYLNILKQAQKPMTSKELVEKTNKSKRVILHYLKKLKDKMLLSVVKEGQSRTYSVR